jgi:hypothetical protein
MTGRGKTNEKSSQNYQSDLYGIIPGHPGSFRLLPVSDA